MKRRRTTQGTKGVAKTRRTQTSLITPKLNPPAYVSKRKQPLWNVGEQKVLDTHYPMTAIGAGATVCMPTVVSVGTGTGANQRVGQQINATKLHIRGLLRKPQIALQTVVENIDSMRVMVILDKQANGTAPVSADILATPGGVTETKQFLAFNELRNSQRFTVLKDAIFRIQRETLTASPTAPLNTVYSMAVEKYFSFHIDLKGIPINFNATGTAGNVNLVTTNNILFVVLPKGADIGGSPTISLEMLTRLRYTDK